MQKYSLKNMISGKSGTSSNVPVIPESLAFSRAYLAELRRLLHAIAAATRAEIIPSYRVELVRDARESNFEALRRVVRSLVMSTNGQVKQLLELESMKHTERFHEAARSAFKIDLKSVVKSEDLEAYIDAAALRNAGLVTGMTDDLVKQIQTLTTNSLISGETVKTLQGKLKAQFDISDNRARLIARDQTNKLNADLNKIRHKQAGVEEYVWRTSRDERVREDHRRVNGEQYKYGEATGTNSGAEPGQDIQCRCIAQAVITFGEPVVQKTPEPVVKLPQGVVVPKATPAPVVKLPERTVRPLPEIPDATKTAKFIVENDIAEQGSSFKDFEPDGLAEMLMTQHMLNQRFGMKKLAAFGNNGWAAGKGKGLKKAPNQVAGWFGFQHNVMGFNSLTSSRQGLRELSSLSEYGVKKSLSKRLAVIDKIKDAELKRKALEFAEDFRYQSVPVTPASVVAHENGHRFHANYYKAIEEALVGWDEGWEMLLSQYGTTNRFEYVAESFALYTSDRTQHWRIKPELLKIFKDKDATL